MHRYYMSAVCVLLGMVITEVITKIKLEYHFSWTTLYIYNEIHTIVHTQKFLKDKKQNQIKKGNSAKVHNCHIDNSI